MAKVTIKIHGRPYDIACDDGEEDRLLGLAEMLDERVSNLGQQMGSIGETRLLVLAGLLMADEVNDLDSKLEEAGREARFLQAGTASTADSTGLSAREDRLAEMLDKAAERIETIAAAMEAH